MKIFDVKRIWEVISFWIGPISSIAFINVRCMMRIRIPRRKAISRQKVLKLLHCVLGRKNQELSSSLVFFYKCFIAFGFTPKFSGSTSMETKRLELG